MNIKKDIELLLHELLSQLDLEIDHKDLEKISPEVDFSVNEKFGDVSTNIALQLHSHLKQLSASLPQELNSPRAVADKIVTQIMKQRQQNNTTQLSKHIKAVTVAGPGFINFTLSDDYLFTELDRVNDSKDNFGKKTNTSPKDSKIAANKTRKSVVQRQRIIIEFTDPNPFKVFHMGHLYSNIIGESLARLLESQGHEIRRACYQGDVGMHVAKALYGLIEQFHLQASDINQTKELLKDLQSKSLKERVYILGEAYAKGANAYKDDPTAQARIKHINFLVFASAQKRLIEEENWQPQVDYSELTEIEPDDLAMIDALFQTGRKWSLEAFEQIYQRLGTKFDAYYFESVVGEYGYKTVKDNLGSTFVESSGAIIFPGSKYGLHDRVFINSLGLPTYEAKELGLAPKKYEDWAYDQSIIVTGNEINEYFKVLLKAMSLTHPQLAIKTTHIGHGMLRLPEGKMSSRTGNILTGETILDEAKSRVMEIMKVSDVSILNRVQDDTSDDVAEMVGQAAIKYALLRANIGGDVIFDFKESINFNGNSGPYLQYTYARCLSVLLKAQLSTSGEVGKSSVGQTTEDRLSAAQHILKQIEWSKLHIELNHEERAVLNWLWRFEDAVERAATEYAPHYVATYIYELAQRFNGFYNKHSILGNQLATDSKAVSDDQILLRLALTAATAQVLQNGLQLLGIHAPERM